MDAEWELVGPFLARKHGWPGQPRRDSRRMLDGILWRAREDVRWRALPERCGKWGSIRRRFARWCNLGAFEALFAALADCGLAEERLRMLGGTVVRAHQHAAGAKGSRTARHRARAA
jgi:transposase